MKKIVGIVIGLIIAVAIVAGIFAWKNKSSVPETAPTNEAMVQLFDNYLAKINKGEDEYIYNNMLGKKLRNQYTLNQIKQMNNYARSLGEVKDYDRSKVKIEEKEDNKTNIYVITSNVDFAKSRQRVRIKLNYENNDLKIFAFSFSPVTPIVNKK